MVLTYNYGISDFNAAQKMIFQKKNATGLENNETQLNINNATTVQY